ncbi:transcription-associated protein 1, partial [Conglomerata obtusa]
MEIIEKISEIFRIRDDKILFKALEITSLLPSSLPELFLTEIIDITYLLEQRNRLLNIDKNSKVLKEICEKNPAILSLYMKRLNDFCIFKILSWLVKNSFMCKNHLKENPIITENLFSILLFDEIQSMFNVSHCFTAIRVYKDLKLRNKDVEKILRFLRKAKLNGEHINILYQIDDNFIFINPKEKFLLEGLTLESYKKLAENHLRILEANKTNEQLMEITNDGSTSGINDEHLAFYSALENLMDTNIDNEFKGVILTIFYRERINSEKIIRICSKYTTKNNMLKYKALLYLSVFEPDESYFEMFIHAHFEYKEYTRPGLRLLIKYFGPDKFENVVFKMMKNQIAYKNHLYIIYPLLIDVPELITYNITLEIFDVICRLFGTMISLHQKIGINLLERIYQKYEYLINKTDISESDKNIIYGLSISYTLLFSNYCHSKEEIAFTKINQFLMPINFSFLFFVEESLVIPALACMIDNELNKNIGLEENELKDAKEAEVHILYDLNNLSNTQTENLEYKYQIGLHLNNYIKKCFNDTCIKESFMKFVDIPFLFQQINRFFTNQENPKTVYLIFIHLMKIKQNTNKLTIQETALFDMFVHLSNIFVSINLDFAKDIIIAYLNATKDSNSNNQLLQLLQEIIKSGCFSSTTFIIENILFILEDKNITLAEKLSFIDNFKYTDEFNLSFIITYFNQRPDLRLILQKPFLLGLRSRDPLLRNEFYSTFNQNVSKSYFGRLRYLLNFDWSPYGDNWLYAFFRMSHLGLSDIYFETFKLYVYGDDTFYENIYEESEEYCKKLKRYKPNVNINEFIRNHIYPFVSNTAKYKSKNLANLIFDILFDDVDAINNIFPLFFVEVLKKLTIEEFKIIVNEFIAMILKKQNLDDFKSFYEGFSLLCDFYEKSENNVNKLYASDVCTRRLIINTLEMKIKYIKDCFSDLKYIVNHRNSSSLIPLLNVVDDLHKVEIYRILQEKDHYYGLLKAICKYPATLIALNTHLNSDEKKAMELYEELQDKARLNELSFNEDEYEILEREWIECAKTLQQWDILYELGNFSGDCPLITDASFRTCNFLLESERSNVSGIIELRKKTVQRQFYENFIDFMAYERIDAGQMYSNDFIMARTAQDLQMKNKLMLLKKDYLLYLHSYPLCTKQTSETLLFIKMIDEMINPPNNFDLISNYESIQNWDIFVTFRMHLYDLLAKREPSKKYYHEKARALNAISKKCRKEKYYELSMYTLQKIFVLPSIEANDAYKKIAGEIKVLYEGGNYQNAIEIANLCNLNFFNNQKKANIFAWKGRLAEKINDFDDANRNFLHAIQIDSSIGKNWYSWGIYLDRKFEDYINTLELYEDEINDKTAIKNKINKNSSLNNLDGEQNQNVINDSINNKNIINNSNHDKDLLNNSRIDETLMKMDNLGLSNNTIDDKLNKNLSHENLNLTNDNIKNNSEEFFKININENENILININGDVKQGDKNSIKLTENYINQLKVENKDLLLNVFSAFLQSASLNSGSKARKSVLKLLKYFKFKNEGVKTTFEAHKDDIDITKCFFFIPQLISMMNTDYYDCAQIVLLRMIEKYPQSVFLHLRSEMDRSERLNGKKLEEESSQLLYDVFMKRDSQVKSNFSYSRLTNLFGSSSFYLASTFFTLEKIVSDLIIKMRCSAEEDVYRMSDAIFNESINKIFDDSPYSCDDLAVLIERMNCVLEKSRIGSKYKLEFKKDFYKQESLSLVELARIAMKWTSIFKNILKSVPVIINLGIIKTINDYNSFNMGEVQVFGQYNEIRNIYDNFVTIESFEPATITTWRNGTSIKRVIIRGNNGKKYAFAFCDPISNVYRREDRSIQLAEFMHSEMDYNMRFKSYVNLSEKSRLISIHEDYYFYDDILNENLITKGLCVGDLIFKYLGYLHVDFKNLINVNKNEALKCFSDRDLNPERERPIDVSKDSSTSGSKNIKIESNENNNDVCDLKRDANNVNSECSGDEQKNTDINETYDAQKFIETNANCSGDVQKDSDINGTIYANKIDVKNSKINDFNCKDSSKIDNNEINKKHERNVMKGNNRERNVFTLNFNDTINNH